MIGLAGRTAVVTGGTDGIGAATALRLYRQGAHVTIIGRSQAKADALTARAAAEAGRGSLRAVVADLSEMATVEATVNRLAGDTPAIDVLVHAVGILLPRTEHTVEGMEKDFAVGYLSRFVFLEAAARHHLLHPGTRMINIAASSPKIPSFARMEFTDLAEVQARVGMRSHGQAQLANDLLTAQAPVRYGISAVGYGPGSVNTNIRREVPALIRAIMKPFFALVTRPRTRSPPSWSRYSRIPHCRAAPRTSTTRGDRSPPPRTSPIPHAKRLSCWPAWRWPRRHCPRDDPNRPVPTQCRSPAGSSSAIGRPPSPVRAHRELVGVGGGCRCVRLPTA
jgi:NAD(P)-dependent dehydrogenase (short-subunit alcohol dehydrogenase family)